MRTPGGTPSICVVGEYSWCASTKSAGAICGFTCAARTSAASRALATAVACGSSVEKATQPTSPTAATVAAAAQANDSGRAARGFGDSTVGSAPSRAAKRRENPAIGVPAPRSVSPITQ